MGDVSTVHMEDRVFSFCSSEKWLGNAKSEICIKY